MKADPLWQSPLPCPVPRLRLTEWESGHAVQFASAWLLVQCQLPVAVPLTLPVRKWWRKGGHWFPPRGAQRFLGHLGEPRGWGRTQSEEHRTCSFFSCACVRFLFYNWDYIVLQRFVVFFKLRLKHVIFFAIWKCTYNSVALSPFIMLCKPSALSNSGTFSLPQRKLRNAVQ